MTIEILITAGGAVLFCALLVIGSLLDDIRRELKDVTNQLKKAEMMKRKVSKMNTHAGTGRTCGECCRGEWNTNNFNYQGKPFLCYCEHSTYAKMKDGRGVCYDNTEACSQFKEGQKDEPR